MLGFIALIWTMLGLASAQDDAAFEAALRVLGERYPAEMKSGALYRAAIAGMADHVDELSATDGSGVLTERDMARLSARQRGERQGIGVQFFVLPGQGLVVNQVFSGSTAEKAGIRSGDLVVAVNDVPLTGQSGPAILNMLGAVQPPRVMLDVRRVGAPTRTYSVAWGTYWLGAVEACVGTEVQCVVVQHLGVGSSAALEQALIRLDPAKGVLIDLRMCEEGVLDEMLSAADLFLEAGEVVVQQTTPGASAAVVSTAHTPEAWGGRVVLLVDEGTSGLAEAFAVALREQAGARLVGTTTSGRGSTESYLPLGGGLTLRLADVQLRSPAGRSWSAHGLAPDVVVEHPDVFLPVVGSQDLPDLQLEAAIRMVRGM